ncbi:hypothetical protein WISP_125957 [Willisornis vidua]|uniref:DRBM domain-containing protein n=1 Tax=Willisornis vidua TaxID=1566151 RepID=A0ABQ9CR01_9PASS|nr:hypothetical protein WISP_125957 [Willisornis vidua]
MDLLKELENARHEDKSDCTGGFLLQNIELTSNKVTIFMRNIYAIEESSEMQEMQYERITYHCPVPKIFYVQLTVGNSEFFGEGKTRQAARHNAAMKALQALQNEPIPEKLPQNGETGKESEEDKDANKSEISVVFEIALKRNIPVSFEVIKESGPPHMKSFVTRVTVGEFTAEGEGNSKKLSKKRAAMAVLQELKKLPPLPVIEKPKLYFKKRPKTILKTGPEYGQGMNPISRLAQIQQAKKEKEPEYVLLSERGMPRRREFVMQVKVGNDITTGTGPNKKIAKRNAAEAMLLQLGYKASTPLQDQPEKLGENKSWNGQNVGFSEPTSNKTENWKWDTSEHADNAVITLNFSEFSSPLWWGNLSLSLYQQGQSHYIEADRTVKDPFVKRSLYLPSQGDTTEKGAAFKTAGVFGKDSRLSVQIYLNHLNLGCSIHLSTVAMLFRRLTLEYMCIYMVDFNSQLLYPGRDVFPHFSSRDGFTSGMSLRGTLGGL